MKKLAFFLLLGFLVACASESKHEVQIGKTEFADLLIDLYANEGIFSGTYNLDSASAVVLFARNDETLKKHKVTKEQFLETYRYYQDNKKELEKVYQIALDSISARRERLGKTK